MRLHAICAAIEEVTKWLSENGVGSTAANAIAAMETLDTNAQGITDAIMRLAASINRSHQPRHRGVLRRSAF
ncbi:MULTISPECIES: hypothetical protein [Pseudomonas]|uniref:hypothetical protein n=1 Tax=Pseudomonas TaxID=286 RepID=UPI00117AF0AC|nr:MULTISPECIES: hypothetical protein [Pseudomonas]MCK8656531.1 hypothetical protein [Pseudomonas umsongensis]